MKTVPVKHYPGASTLSGVIDYPHDAGFEWVEGRVSTGDDYCREHSVSSLDLLKVDTEGSDLQVLRGFREMLERRAIDVVQFEYGRASITSRAYPQAVVAFDLDESVGKDTPPCALC